MSLAILQCRVGGHDAGKQAEASKGFGLGPDERKLESRAVAWRASSRILDESR